MSREEDTRRREEARAWAAGLPLNGEVWLAVSVELAELVCYEFGGIPRDALCVALERVLAPVEEASDD